MPYLHEVFVMYWAFSFEQLTGQDKLEICCLACVIGMAEENSGISPRLNVKKRSKLIKSALQNVQLLRGVVLWIFMFQFVICLGLIACLREYQPLDLAEGIFFVRYNSTSGSYAAAAAGPCFACREFSHFHRDCPYTTSPPVDQSTKK